MAPAVFKTDVAEHLGQAGSIPVRLRRPPCPVIMQVWLSGNNHTCMITGNVCGDVCGVVWWT